MLKYVGEKCRRCVLAMQHLQLFFCPWITFYLSSSNREIKMLAHVTFKLCHLVLLRMMSIKRADPPIYFTAAEIIYTFCPKDLLFETVICPQQLRYHVDIWNWYIMETWYRCCGRDTDTSRVFGILSKTDYIRIVLFTLSTLRLLVFKTFRHNKWTHLYYIYCMRCHRVSQVQVGVTYIYFRL